MSVNSKMTAIADEVRTLSGTTGALGLDAMATNIGAANTEIGGQTDLIAQIVGALEGKAAGGSGASVETCNVTLSLRNGGMVGTGTYVTVYDNGKVVTKQIGDMFSGSLTTCTINNVVCGSLMAYHDTSWSLSGGGIQTEGTAELLTVAYEWVFIRMPSVSGENCSILLI